MYDDRGKNKQDNLQILSHSAALGAGLLMGAGLGADSWKGLGENMIVDPPALTEQIEEPLNFSPGEVLIQVTESDWRKPKRRAEIETSFEAKHVNIDVIECVPVSRVGTNFKAYYLKLFYQFRDRAEQE